MRGRIEDIVQEEMGNFWCGTFPRNFSQVVEDSLGRGWPEKGVCYPRF